MEHKVRFRSGSDELTEAELPLIPGQQGIPAQRQPVRPEPGSTGIGDAGSDDAGFDDPGFDDEIDTDVGDILAATLADDVPGSSVDPLTPALSDREQGILAFEKQPWRHSGSKEQAIRDRFQLSATRYYQVLNALLDNPAALEFDPVLVGRLRRLRGSRARARRR